MYLVCGYMVASSRGFVEGYLLAAARKGKGTKALCTKWWPLGWHKPGSWVLLLFLSSLCGYMVASSRGFVEGLLLAASREGKGTKALPVQHGGPWGCTRLAGGSCCSSYLPCVV